jgi:pyridoxamine 5'-phosphate oxidase
MTGMPETSFDPFVRFAEWLAEASAGETNDPNAMTLATATADGRPSARIVLLKGVDPEGASPRGFVFYTNLGSQKGEEIAANPHVALLFHWKTLRRQVRIEGAASLVPPAEADAYFATRARISRLGAIASEQSRPLPDRATLEARVAALEAEYPEDDIPRPATWSGFRVVPERFEFWQDMPFRLHDRFVLTPDEAGTGWRTTRLYP